MNNMQKITLNSCNIEFTDGKIIVNIPDYAIINSYNKIQDSRTCADTKVKLSDLNPNDKFKIGDETFIVLEQTLFQTKVISKNFVYENQPFGNCSNWKKSPIRTLLNGDFYNKVAKLVGASNIISMKRDLTSSGGLDNYGVCTDKISLLSISEYTKYQYILSLNADDSDWWWTITPASTPDNNYPYFVCCIDSYDSWNWNECVCDRDVRPFFTLNSSLKVRPVHQ